MPHGGIAHGTSVGSWLLRDRLIRPFDDLWIRRLGLVVAPAGWGKTTLLTQIAARAGAPVAWYAAEDVDADADALLTKLQGKFAYTLGFAGEPWRTVGDAVRDLERSMPGRMLLVVDDLHQLEGTRAEATLERLVQTAPPALAVLVASRLAPGWSISRRRVAGELVEVTSDDLRFRSWEVERLFREHYRSSLAPADLAALARCTEGWAAGLQLFHLATRNKSPSQRRQALGFLGSEVRLVREYLIENVLGGLPGQLRRFLLETCVLGCLRAQLCDELRGTTGSQVLLDELERRQLVTSFQDGGHWYRYHGIIRDHLEATYLETVSDHEAKSRYGWAGALLESAGAIPDALRAYCRAEDWEAAARLLGHKGEQVCRTPIEACNWLPPALISRDPWLLLSEARRHRADGYWSKALAEYGLAEQAMPAAGAAELCRRERAALSCWLQPTPPSPYDWSGLLRAALVKEPMTVYRREAGSDDPRHLLVAGLAALAAAAPGPAEAPLAAAATHDAASPTLAAVAEFALAVAERLAGREPEAVDEAVEHLESLGIGALTRFAGTLWALSNPVEGVQEAGELRRSCRRGADLWGEAVAALLQGWAALHAAEGLKPREALEPLEAAAAGFERLGAPVLEVLARSLRALALVRSGNDTGQAAAGQAEVISRGLGSPGAQATAAWALSECTGTRREALRSEAEQLVSDCGLSLPRLVPADTGRSTSPDATGTAVLRCFGPFSLSLGGHTVDLSALKPKARRVLRILGAHCPDWVHREVLVDALWPEADPVTGIRNLHVAISSLRHTLEPYTDRPGCLLVRQGDAYRLALGEDAWIDHVAFDRAIKRAHLAHAAGDLACVKAALEEALDLVGTLLPEEGPDDWLSTRRDHYRSEACHAAQTLGEILINSNDPRCAVVVCERGLTIDRCCDGLWKLLVDAHHAAGDVAAAARARAEYEALLAELAVGSTVSSVRWRPPAGSRARTPSRGRGDPASGTPLRWPG